jgi:hypothetical protein
VGLELHITRAEFWAENDGDQISASEWLAYVATDPELQLDPINGSSNPYQMIWLDQEECWLDWFQGNVYSKRPTMQLFQKMLKIAKVLNARVQSDDGIVLTKDMDWVFDPQRARDDLTEPKVPF